MRLFGLEINRTKKVENLTQQKAKRIRQTIEYEQQLYRARQDIKRLRAAINIAESKTNPNRVELYRIYKDVLLDAHVSACIMQRKNAILCRSFKIKKDGEEIEEQTEILKQRWFSEFLNHCLDAKAWGSSLIDFGAMVDDKFEDICIVPREYVCSEFQVVSKFQGGCDGEDINDPRWIPWNMFIGSKTDLGYLLQASFLYIWKKTTLGNWSEYNEKFGVPMRIGKTAVSDDVMLSNMEDALKNAGSSFWAVVDNNDSIEFLDAEKSGAYEVFDKHVERMNSEISKLVLGQTGTMDEKNFVGSAQVHYAVRQDIIESDATEIEYIVNNKLIPWLNRYHGFSITGTFKFDFAQTMTKQEKAQFVASTMGVFQYDLEWIEEEFNVEISDIVEKEQEPSAEGAAAKKSRTSYENSISSYSFTCKKCGGAKELEVVNISDVEEQLLQSIWLGTTSSENLPVYLYEEIASSLVKAFDIGFGTVNNTSQNEVYQDLKFSVRHFAAAKVYQQVLEIEKLVHEFDNYNDFKIAANSVYNRYNKTWLTTEYNTAVSAARSASLFQTFKLEADILPILVYETVGDARVRPEHDTLDGIRRNVNDSFWLRYMPPNGWGCRCTVTRDEGEETDLEDFEQPEDVPDEFLYNPAVDGSIFPPTHPYFDVKNKSFALKNFGLPI